MGARGLARLVAGWRASRTPCDAAEVEVIAAYATSALVMSRRGIRLPIGVALGLRCREHDGGFVVDQSFDEIDEAAIYHSIRPLGLTSTRGAWTVGSRWQVDDTAISLRADADAESPTPAEDVDDLEHGQAPALEYQT